MEMFSDRWANKMVDYIRGKRLEMLTHYNSSYRLFSDREVIEIHFSLNIKLIANVYQEDLECFSQWQQ